MNISLNDATSPAGGGYDNYPDFKAMVLKYGTDGYDVFYSPNTGTVARRAVALLKAPCFTGKKFDGMIVSGDFQFSATVAANFLTDFPAAIVLGPNNSTLSVSA